MKHRKHNKSLLLISFFKFVKGLLLVALAVGLLHLLHRDVATAVAHLAQMLRINPGNHHLGQLLEKAQEIDDAKLKLISALTFAYSGLFFVEGVGLYFEQRWAEFLTIIATSSLMPIELYELIKHPSWIKAATLVINLAIVAYLIVIVRHSETA
jgi:uncharacterized membrane protein (DUF2068 family)